MILIKLGGSIITNKEKPLSSRRKTINNIMKQIKKIKEPVIIVHGGGPQINRNLESLNFKHKFYKGMRITDEKTLKVVQMVLTGFINKDITINLSKRNILALGIAGTDGKLIEAKKYIIYENMILKSVLPE